MTCPWCGGKMRRKGQKSKEGQPTYKCQSCRRKYIIDYETGRFKQIAV